MARRTWAEVGVDVDARWEGNRLVAVARAPRLGYSGIPPYTDRDEQGAVLVGRPYYDTVQVGAAERVEWRVYRPDDGPAATPLLILPGFNRQDTYNSYDLWWPDPPAEPVRLELRPPLVRTLVSGDQSEGGPTGSEVCGAPVDPDGGCS